MKIFVTVKQVPDTSGKVAVNPDGTLDRASMQTIINPDDLNAVEAALALKDELGCKVIAFTMGPPPAEGMLRELMAMGVDEGVLITAREFGGSDTYATSQIIAAAIDTYGVEADDIILAGRLLTYQAAVLKGEGKRYTKEAAMAKLFCSEHAMKTTTKALQMFGGYGYTKDYPMERMMRDAKITEIYEGTSEVQRMVISSHLGVK